MKAWCCCGGGGVLAGGSTSKLVEEDCTQWFTRVNKTAQKGQYFSSSLPTHFVAWLGHACGCLSWNDWSVFYLAMVLVSCPLS